MHSTSSFALVDGLSIHGSHQEGFEEILSLEAQQFLVKLHLQFNRKRLDLLDNRQTIQQQLDQGVLPTFLPETQHIRSASWQVEALPPDLLDRRVEITGPVDRKMIINALNSGAKVFMADFEDSNAPSWSNNINGQINLRDAVRKTIRFVHPQKDKTYQLNDRIATLMVRPRGWHLDEKHLLYKV